MLWLTFIYGFITLIFLGFMLINGVVWGGIALLISSLLGVAGGGWTRSAPYAHRTWDTVIGLGLPVSGAALAHYSEATIQLTGARFSAVVWVVLGFGLGWSIAAPQDPPGQRRTHKPSDLS